MHACIYIWMHETLIINITLYQKVILYMHANMELRNPNNTMHVCLYILMKLYKTNHLHACMQG